jgi:phosphoglucosamine mutase
MSRRYFGTDGVRGRVGEAPITPDFVMRLAHAAGRVLSKSETMPQHRDRPAVLIGKDTRISGYMLESALEAGLSAAGVDTLLVGPIPTPGVAFLTRALRLSAGIMISASHNPFEDNGIKFFSADGLKLPDSVEHEIEAMVDQPMRVNASAQLGKARRVQDAEGRYIEFCKATFPKEQTLRGVKLVVDCANGAAYRVAPQVLRELGAEVAVIADAPDGLNINEGCGATHPEALARAVMAKGAHFGIALDGDADRLIMVDRDGRVFDGDQLLYAVVKHRHASGRLRGGVVGTLMTNFAFEQALGRMGIAFARASVGDRYVLELLQQKGWELGGESSGHILALDRHSTGDGTISALLVLSALVASGQSLADYTRELEMLPQVLVNVRVDAKFDFQSSEEVRARVAAAEAELAGGGRILLRASGTEPVIRVMVEGPSHPQVSRLAESIAESLRSTAA